MALIQEKARQADGRTRRSPMGKARISAVLVTLALIVGIGASGRQGFPRLQGPYLGQKPPGMTPQPFAPGVITTDEEEGSSGFARNGTVFLFQKFLKNRCHTFITRHMNDAWTAPELVPFWETMVHNGDFVFSCDDRTLLYQVKSETEAGLVSNIWRVELTETGWGERNPLPPPVNTGYDESFASDAADGALYFFSRRAGGKGQSDLYMCPFKDGGYANAVNLESLNTEYHEWDPFIAPDKSYLLFCSTKPGGFGRDDIYVSFKGEDGRWGPSVNLGGEVNSPGSENRPYVTRDGRYFFFTSTRKGSRDVFWVRAEYLDRFRR
jgi:hypothetical protein